MTEAVLDSREVFDAILTTMNGLAVVSPEESMLNASDIFNDQVLAEMPFLADEIVEQFVDLFDDELISEGLILVVGCGEGVLVERLRQSGYSAYGIDIMDSFGAIWKTRDIDDYCCVGNVEDMPGMKCAAFCRAIWVKRG